MPGSHAKLSPSAAERWMVCPGSIRLSERMPEQAESPYAAEGTAAHALAELKARLAFGMITRRRFATELSEWRTFYGVTEDVELEMDLHTDDYVALLKERATRHDHTQLLLEQRLDPGIPQSGGTSDAVLVSPVHIEIIDFKYGAGVAVEAEGNSQLRIYALGALEEYGLLIGDPETVYMTVHQPRMEHVLTAEMTPAALLKWRDEVVIPLAEVALGPDAPFHPTPEACRWCPAAGRCKAQMQAAFPDDLDDADPAELTPEEIAELLPRLPQIKEWMAATEAVALHMAYSEGKTVPGYKVVMSAGKRSVKDHDGAIDALAGAGLDLDDFAVTKAKGIGELEKLCKKHDLDFAELLETPGFVAKGGGSECLVPESDKRPSINPNTEAGKAFADIEEEQQ